MTPVLKQCLLILAQKSNSRSCVIQSHVTLLKWIAGLQAFPSLNCCGKSEHVSEQLISETEISFKRNMAQLYLFLHLTMCLVLWWAVLPGSRSWEGSRDMKFHLYPLFQEVEENGVSDWLFSAVLEIVTIISRHLTLSDALTLLLCEFSCAVWSWQSMCAGA